MAGRTLLTLIAIQAVTVIPFTPASAGDVGLALVRAVPKAEASIRERTYFPLVATPVDPVTGREIVWRPGPDDAIPSYDTFTCSSIRRRVSFEVVERARLWQEMGLMDESSCLELGERDPDADLTTSEKLAKTYDRRIGAWYYEPYPTNAMYVGLRPGAWERPHDPLGW